MANKGKGGFGITGTIDGLSAITALLDDLPAKLRTKIIEKALKKAVRPIATAARSKARELADTGALARSITVKTKEYLEGAVIVAIIGPKNAATQMLTRRGHSKPMRVNPAYYAHLVEFGTKPHRLKLASAATLVNGRWATGNLGREIGLHPGAKAKPFLKPAFDQAKSRVVQIFAGEVEKLLAKELAAAAKAAAVAK